jgi:hypothetical protein
LYMSVLLFPGVGFVIEDVQIPIADLQKIDVARNDIIFEVERESTVTVVTDVLVREVTPEFPRRP